MTENTPVPFGAERATLKHSGHQKQLDFWASNAKWRAFVGGVGSGKTQAGVVEVLRQPSGSRGAIIAPTYRMLEDATIHTFLDVARPFIKKHYSGEQKRIILINNTEVLYRSAEDPERLRGPNLGWFWLDEGALLEEMVWDIMIARLRLPPGKGWVTTTPKGFNWIHKLWVEQGGDQYDLVRCSSRENVFAPEEWLRSLDEKYSGGFHQQEVEAEFCEWGRYAVYEFKRKVNTVKGLHKQYRPDLPLILACDFNYLVKPWAVAQVIDGQPMILNEVVVHGGSIADCITEFRNLYPDHPDELWIYGDATGRGRSAQTGRSSYHLIYHELEGYPAQIRLKVPIKNPPPIERINAVNRMLRGTGVPQLKIDAENCPFLIEDFLMCHWNKAGNDVQKVTDPEDENAKYSHATDAVGYWIWREWPVHRPLPLSTGGRRRTRRRLKYGRTAAEF